MLFIYPPSEWARIEQKLKELPYQERRPCLYPSFFSGAAELEVDKQGRILIRKTCGSMPALKKK